MGAGGTPPRLNPNEWDDWLDEGNIQGMGTAHGLHPAYELNDAEILAYQEEAAEKLKRRIPLGFAAPSGKTPR